MKLMYKLYICIFSIHTLLNHYISWTYDYSCAYVSPLSLSPSLPLMNISSHFFSYTGYISLNDVWISNNLGASWQLSTDNAGWAARKHMAAVTIEGTIVLLGGDVGEYIYIYCHNNAPLYFKIYIH